LNPTTSTITIDTLDTSILTGSTVTGYNGNLNTTIGSPSQYTITSSAPSGWIDTGNNDVSLTIGKSTLTEDKLEKLSALLEIIEDMGDSELKSMLDTQIAFSKIAG
jgi:hypothetical protein|tara:strand:+ start:7427 stop:7744 length:318 start_codon:yes stop_codon:yes gene_type:complete